MNIYFIINGSNDLYYPLIKTVENLLNNINQINNINIYGIYSLIKRGEFYMWRGKNIAKLKYNKAVFIKSSDSSSPLYIKEHFSENPNCSIDIEEFLCEYYKNNDTNILIISGHGGPFQSLLDMSVSPAKSINTANLCSILKRFKFKLIFFDMCAMNYLEIIYDIFKDSNIENLITYKNLAPFKGLDYITLINSIKNCEDNIDNLINLDLPIIHFKKECISCLEEIKTLHNDIALKCFTNKNANFDKEVHSLKSQIENIANESQKSKLIKHSPINYIKYYLSSYEDRCIYCDFLYSKDNMWTNFIIRNCILKKINYTPLSKENIKSIIKLHNQNLSNDMLNKLVEKYIMLRNEKKFYYKK